MSPQQTAHYRITCKLGEGGMGAVSRATDTKLNREVAIKVLPPVFAQDRDRIARFEREALVLGSLNHPNIAAIYGVESRAIVMEFEFSLHDLRHAHATIKLENGASLEAVSKDLGHASSAITLGVYSHLLRKNQAASSEIWSRAMAGVMADERKHLKDR